MSETPQSPADASSAKDSLRGWIWRAFVQSALVPLVLVEAVLIAVYLLTNTAIRDAQIGHLRETALGDLQATAEREARIIDERLAGIGRLTDLFRAETRAALLDTGYQPDALERARHALSADGVFHTTRNDGRAASFYANSTPVEQQDHERALRLSRLDPLMRAIQEQHELVTAVYFNTSDSYNRIYPWFDTLAQYPPDMVIPDYNFYYLADAKHNPRREVVWTDVYVDPAGQGWMLSAIAPVYLNNADGSERLEGVVGLDVTVDKALREISALPIPWRGYALLVSDQLSIMALPPAGETDFGLRELTRHTYAEAIRREQFKPDDFRLDRRTDTQALAQAVQAQDTGVMSLTLGGRSRLVAWATIGQTRWHLLTVVDEADVFRQTQSLASHYQQIGYWLIAGLIGFYLLFFAWMWGRARLLSRRLVEPLAAIGGMMAQIGRGQWYPPVPDTRILELGDMAQATRHMGAQLGESERERQQARRQLELVLEGATESVWDIELPARRMRISGRFVDRFGLPAESVSEALFNAHIHPDDLRRIASLRDQIIRGETDVYDVEYRFSDRDGVYHWLLSRGRVLQRDPVSGEARQIAGTHVDITRLKAVEAELRRASEEAQSASLAKTRFLSSMSHELRTPLNAISGFAQMIQAGVRQADGVDGQAARDMDGYAGEILEASRHLTQLVDDILDLSRIEAERPSLRLASVDVRELMSTCADLVRLDVRDKGLTLELDTLPQPLCVQADPRRLRQILLNLLSNAIKYNRPGGLVRLSYERSGDRVRLIVADTGRGISADRQAQLFQPFQRLGHENSAIPGTGIGLVLCRELASLMGGSMGFASQPGVGSTFWVDLHACTRSPDVVERPDGHADVTVPASALPRVLYVEDNRASQKLVQQVLRDVARVDVLASGSEALRVVFERPPAVLLLDLHLPDMDGLSVLQELRRDPSTQTLPVVIISAAAMTEDLERVRTLDVAAYLTKPLDVDALRKAVQALLDA